MLQKFRYKNEAEFSKALVKHLRAKGCFVQRIESGETGRGIPDIYCVLPTGKAIWLELKREHSSYANMPTPIHIHWRLGQQAWMYKLSVLYKQPCYTLACLDDVLLQIPHDRIYKDDEVSPTAAMCHYSLNDLL